MYTIKYNDNYIYMPGDKDYVATAPVLNLKANKAGTLVYSIMDTHPLYNELEKLRLSVSVLKDEKVVFKGRIIGSERNFDNELEMTVEGKLAVLNDSPCRPLEFTGTPEELFEWFLDNHNSQVGEDQKLLKGTVTVTDPNNYISRSWDKTDNTWNLMNSRLLDTLGGYLVVRYEDDGDYLDWIKEFTYYSEQSIEFGKNLTDFEQLVDAEETYTACIPYGAEIVNYEYQETDKESATWEEGAYYTLSGGTYKLIESESAFNAAVSNGTTIYSVASIDRTGRLLTIESVNGGKDYLINEDRANLFGTIYAPTDLTTWEDVSNPSNLLEKAEDWLNNTGIMLKETIELSAVDLATAGVDINAFEMCENVSIVSEPHGIDTSRLITELTKALDLSEVTKVVLGSSRRTLSAQNVETKKQNEAAIDTIYQKMLNTANKSDVSNVKIMIEKQMQTLTDNIIGKNGGYFSITYNDDGLPTGWTIMDSPVLEDDTKMWIMSEGGLGFSEDGGKTVKKIAFDMDGNFHADCITTGTIIGLKYLSSGEDRYNYPSNMTLDGGCLNLTSVDGNVTFKTNIAGHDVLLEWLEKANNQIARNFVLMNGNGIKHDVSRDSLNYTTVFHTTENGVEVSSIDINNGITGPTDRPLYNGKSLALYSDLTQSGSGGSVEVPVTSVNRKTGDVVLSAEDVGARPSTWTPSASEVGADPSGTAAGMMSVLTGELNTHMSKVDQKLQELEGDFERAGEVEWKDIVDKPFGEVVRDEGNRQIYRGNPTWSTASIPSAVITPTEPLFWDTKYTMIVNEDVVYNCSIGSEDILNNITYTTQDEKIRFSAHGENGEQILVEMLDGTKPTTLEFRIISRQIVEKQLDPKFIPGNIGVEWDYVVNKPFGETKQNAIEWDGETVGRENFAFGVDTPLYHVSDLVCEYEDLLNGGGIHFAGAYAPNPADVTFSSENVYKLNDDLFYVYKEGKIAIVCLKDNLETSYEEIYALSGTPSDAKTGTAIFPKRGVYLQIAWLFVILFHADKFYLNDGYFVKYEPLGPEYLPEVPYFDLAAMGLPAVAPDGSYVSVNADTTEIMKALEKGLVNFGVNVSMDADPLFVTVAGSIMCIDGTYQAGMVGCYNGLFFSLNLEVYTGVIGAACDIIRTVNMPTD